MREGQNRSGPYYSPRIRYRYSVGDHVYTGGRRAFRATGGSGFVASVVAFAELNDLELGNTVSVYYHPWLPRLSVLRPGMDSDDVFVAACGLIVLAAGRMS